jgi:hypothetical protein
MHCMSSRQPASRWALWAFALALLLKAAVPLLAAASAHAQGKSLVEVCTVYGVATVELGAEDSTPRPDPAPTHHGEHCALGAAIALGALAAPLVALVGVEPVGAAPSLRRASQAPDACATWAARLRHGPPTLV